MYFDKWLFKMFVDKLTDELIQSAMKIRAMTAFVQKLKQIVSQCFFSLGFGEVFEFGFVAICLFVWRLIGGLCHVIALVFPKTSHRHS